MSYAKNTWKTGDIVTAEKLNNIELGVERNDILVIPVQISAQTLQGGTEQVSLSLSLQDLNNAYNDGKTLVVEITAEYGGAYIKRKISDYSAATLSGNIVEIVFSNTTATVITNKLEVTHALCAIRPEDDQLVAVVTVEISTIALTE